MRVYQNNSPYSFNSTFFKNRKFITFSNLNFINFKDDFKDNFMREKVASKAKT